MPVTATAGLLAACSMAGVPLFAGFIGKDLLYEAPLRHGAAWATLLLAIAIGVSAFLGATGLTAGLSPFAGRTRDAGAKHPVSLALETPPLALAVAGVVIGLSPAMLDLPVDLAARSVLGNGPSVHLALWHGAGTVLLLSLLTLAAAGALYVCATRFVSRSHPAHYGLSVCTPAPFEVLIL